MDIYKIREQLKTKQIYDIPIRVTFYARVSTEKDEQLNSLENQKAYYKDFISSNKQWSYVDGYIDEGLSAITTTKRERFNDMIEDAKSGKFDLIITKEVSRFARNLLDSIHFTRDLLRSNVGVFFQGDNINTADDEGELRLSIMATLAQEESRKISSRVKFGHAQAIKNGVVLGNSRLYGYDKDKGKLVINEAEAEMVKELFELYSTNEYSLKQIEDVFWDRGYRNHKGNKIAHNTMSNILSNPKYKGYYVGNKVKIVDMFTKKQKFLDESEWHIFKDETSLIVPAIVSEEVWEKANTTLNARSQCVKSRTSSFKRENLFTSKIICTEHNVPFYLKENADKRGNNNPTWRCSHKIKNGAKSCLSVSIYENDLKEMLSEAIMSMTADVDSITDKYIKYYTMINESSKLDDEIEKRKKAITFIEKKKDKILEYNINGKISDDEFIRRNDEFNLELIDIKAEHDKLIIGKNKSNGFLKEITNIKEVLKKCCADGKNIEVNKKTVDLLVDKIYVTPFEHNEMNIQIALKSANKATYSYHRNKGCSGNTFKKMIEAYENSVK